MSNPAPAKLASLCKAVQERWKRPEQHLVECGEIAVLRRMWLSSRGELQTLDDDLREVARLMARIEERLPVGRDIVFWANDPTASVPLSYIAESLGVTCEELRAELFKCLDQKTMSLLTNAEHLQCPLCDKRK